MKKVLGLLLLGVFWFQLTFASTPAEDKANELKPLIKLILERSKNKDADRITVKNIFLSCQATCKDEVVKEASKLILATYDQDFGGTEVKQEEKKEEKSDFSTYSLLEVVDGDTIKIKDSAGKEYTVRMIGLDTPESNSVRYGYIECYGAEASAHLKSLLQGVSQIQLEIDPSQWTTDKYGRLLGYVRSNGVNLNQKMIEDGYGFEYTYNLPYKYQSVFKNGQKQASVDKKGLWSDSACAGERKAVVSEEKKPEAGSSEDYPLDEEYNFYKQYYTWPKGGCYYLAGSSKVYVEKSYCSRDNYYTPKTSTSSYGSSSSYTPKSYDSSTPHCYTWPRGGRYYYNSKGKKVYGC